MNYSMLTLKMLNKGFFSYGYKGFFMGVADIIPGISGGTVALILGIYETFISSLANVKFNALLTLKLRDFFLSINFSFFIPLGLGILCAVFSMSHLLTWLLQTYPPFVWSFFFGLVSASVLLLIFQYSVFRPRKLPFLVLGILIGFIFTGNMTIGFPEGSLGLFMAGGLASMAMVLPGISGSYVLVLIGMYPKVLQVVKSFDLFPLCIFCCGVGLGIIACSHAIKKLLEKYPIQTYAILFGFIVGSLRNLWPWKVEQSYLLPQLNNSGHLVSIGLMILPFFLIFFLSRKGKKKS